MATTQAVFVHAERKQESFLASVEKRCLIWLVGGSHLREWAADFIAKLEDWARSLGCVTLRGVGRPGWAQIVKKFGGVSVDAVDGLPAWERRIA